MAWDESGHAGFSSGEPWLPLHADWPIRNVAVERADSDSMWHLYRALLAVRRAHPALALGEWHPVAASESILAYERRMGDERVLVVLNLSATPAAFARPEWARGLRPILSTVKESDDTMLAPHQGTIYA
jgi:alpha-glucosidase